MTKTYRFLVVGRFYEVSFASHIAETLEAMGHMTICFEAGLHTRSVMGRVGKRIEQVRSRIHDAFSQLPAMRKIRAARLERAARDGSVDLAIVCHDFLAPEEVRRLRDAIGGPVVMWFPDAISNFGRAYFLNAPYDRVFFKDPYIVEILARTLTIPVHYLPECCDPRVHRPVALDEEDRRVYGCDLATAGNLHAYRVAFFAQLRDHQVRIWGNPPPLWMQTEAIRPMLQGRYVAGDEKVKAILGARIVLNNLHPAEIWGLNSRAFEVAGCGGFQLLDWRPGLAQLFEEDRELVSFRSLPELREKIAIYLNKPDARAEIARRGMERAHREHTYERRLETLIATAAGDAEGYPMPHLQAGAAAGHLETRKRR